MEKIYIGEMVTAETMHMAGLDYYFNAFKQQVACQNINCLFINIVWHDN